jgi:hypothetical protein
VKSQFDNLGLQMPPAGQTTPEALGDWQQSEIAKWWPMLKAAHVSAD